jgi:hypothetical protein
MGEVKDFVFHGVKARKVGRYIFERGGRGDSIKYIDGAVWFADGSLRKDPVGRKFAKIHAEKMRKKGYKARIVVMADEIQVFCNKRAGASL